MSELNDQLERVERELREQGHPVDHLHKLASILMRVAESQRNASFAEFHNFAGRLPYAQDMDIGALILEYIADAEAPAELKPRLYREAGWRAKWCATAATAAGEGYARIDHVDRLMTKQMECPTTESTPTK